MARNLNKNGGIGLYLGTSKAERMTIITSQLPRAHAKDVAGNGAERGWREIRRQIHPSRRPLSGKVIWYSRACNQEVWRHETSTITVRVVCRYVQNKGERWLRVIAAFHRSKRERLWCPSFIERGSLVLLLQMGTSEVGN